MATLPCESILVVMKVLCSSLRELSNVKSFNFTSYLLGKTEKNFSRAIIKSSLSIGVPSLTRIRRKILESSLISLL